MPLNERTIPSDAPRSIANYVVVCEGETLPRSYHLISLRVQHQLNRVPFAQLVLLDGEASQETFALSSEDYFAPGRKIEILLGYGEEQDSLFAGLVTRHRIKVRGSSSVLMVECRGRASLMTLSAGSRHFLDRRDSEIIEELIQLHGLEAEVEPTEWVHGQMVQHHASDWDFLVCRAEANGYLVHARGDKIQVGPPNLDQEPVLRVQYGATVHELDAQIDARWQMPELEGRSWDSSIQEIQTARAEDPPLPEGGNLSPQDLAQSLGTPAYTLRYGGELASPELQQWVNAKMLKHRLAKIRGMVRIDGTAAIQPGQCFELHGVGDRFEGKLFVSALSHELDQGQWQTSLEFGLSPQWFAEEFDLRQPAAGGVIPPASGLHLGQVRALESDPLGHHRIQVSLPLFHSDSEGIWARLGRMDAGKERGWAWVPEIGDEVVVGFLHEDPRQAVILGSLHSAHNPPPWEAKDENNLKGLRSREGLEVILDEEKKEMVVQTPAGNRIRLSDDEGGIFLEDQHGNKLILDADGIRMESQKDLMTRSANKTQLDSGTDLRIKGGTEVLINGSVTAEFSSGGSTTIKGSVVQIN